MSVNITQGTQTAIATDTTGTVEYQSVRVDVAGTLPAGVFGTVVSTGTTTLGTIKAAVSGSVIYVTDIVVSVGSATTLVIGNGGTNLPLLGTLSLGQYGGMVSNFNVPIYTSAGSALVYQQSVGCPLTITCQGYVR